MTKLFFVWRPLECEKKNHHRFRPNNGLSVFVNTNCFMNNIITIARAARSREISMNI